jgi:hypothetical protein
MEPERRKHQRLAIRLPLECRFPGAAEALRSCTRDISTGGVCFDLELPAEAPVPELQSALSIAVTIPPGPGHSPYEGCVSAAAEVLRCSSLPEPKPGCERYGIAARFKQPFQLRFC